MRALSRMDANAGMVVKPLEEALPSGVHHLTARDWCIDQDTRDNVIARRNVLAALWAGQLMRLSGDQLTRYAAQVHFADYAVAGDEDVVLKLVLDLDAAGISVPMETVRRTLASCHRRALLESGVTD